MRKFTDLTLEQYLQELASSEPVPGGGSVSAYAAALAAGLTQMVARISLKRKKKQGLTPEDEKKETERRASIQKIVDRTEEIKKKMFEIVNLDPAIYAEVMSAPADKQEEALWKSFQMQEGLSAYVIEARNLNSQLMLLVSGSIKNDLLVSEALSKAAFYGAMDTAKINGVYMKDLQNKKKAEDALHNLQEKFEK